MAARFTAAVWLELGLALTYENVSLLSDTISSSIQFCDTSNVSDLILQCASSHVDFQALQFYAINCSMSSILHQVLSRQIHDPTYLSTCGTFLNREHRRHARLGLSVNKKPLRHYFVRHSVFFHGAGRIMLSCGRLVFLFCNCPIVC